MAWRRHRNGAKTRLEGIHSIAYGGVGWDRLFHGRGPYLAQAGDVPRLVLHSSGEPPRQLGRDHEAHRPSVDATNGRNAPRRRGDSWISISTHCMIATRSSSLFRATLAAGKTASTPGAHSPFEFSRRAMGAISERRMLIQADLVRRSLLKTGANRLHRS